MHNIAIAVWIIASLLITSIAYRSKNRKGDVCFGCVVVLLMSISPSAEEYGRRLIEVALFFFG